MKIDRKNIIICLIALLLIISAVLVYFATRDTSPQNLAPEFDQYTTTANNLAQDGEEPEAPADGDDTDPYLEDIF